VTFVEAPGPERLRHQRIESEEQPHREDRDREEHHARQADRPDRARPEAADHDGVDDAHRDPAELGHHDGRRQRQHRAEFGSDHFGLILVCSPWFVGS
jgi:hypothetical protein